MRVVGNDIVVFGREFMSLHQLLDGDGVRTVDRKKEERTCELRPQQVDCVSLGEPQIPVHWDVIVVIGLPGVMMLREDDRSLSL